VSVTLRPTGSLELPSEQGILFAGSQLLPIERCRVADEQEVMERYLWAQAPVIFTRAMDSWPAMRKWSFDFFAQHMGDEQVIAKDDLVSANAIRRVKMREFLLYCRYPFFSELGKVASSRPFYVSYPPFGMHPELLNDIRHPGVLKNSYLQLQGELLKWYYEIFGWIYIGPQGTVTPLHVDQFMSHTWIAQIAGSKRFLFISPQDFGGIPDRKLRDHLRSDCFYEEGDDENEVCDKSGQKLKAYEGILSPGELLFFPAGWAHYVVSLEPSISVSFNYANESNLIPHVMMISRKLPQWARKLDSARFREANRVTWTTSHFASLGREDRQQQAVRSEGCSI